MKLQNKQVVSLGENKYRVIDSLGSGAVSDVYLAAPIDTQMPSEEVVIKLVRDDANLDFSKKVEGLRREAEVLKILNKAEDTRWPVRKGLRARLERARATVATRRAIALLDSGEISDGASSQPFVVQEKAPPAFSWPTVTGLADERHILAVAEAIASLMALAHRRRLTFKDFDPGSKWDRIRVPPLSPGESPPSMGGRSAGQAEGPSFELKLIDWNITGTATPEEVAQDLFFFGGHLYHFLLGSQVMWDMNGQPPARLGLGIAAWEQITVGSRQLLERLLHRDPARRYQRARELEADLSWWLETLRLASSPRAQQPLQRRMLQARRQKRHDRVLALTELALTLELPSTARQTFATWSKQAQQELSKAIRLPIAMAQATLLTGNYEKASEQFNKQLQSLPAHSPTARLARLYLRLARAGSELQKAYEGADIRKTSEWEALSEATTALSQAQWSEAEKALREATAHRSDVADFSAVAELRGLAQAGWQSKRAAKLLADSEPRPADAKLNNWTDIEAQKVADLSEAVELLRKAQKLAPLEPEFGEQLQAAEARYEQRQAQLDDYQKVDAFIKQGEQDLEAATNEPDRQAAARRYQEAAASFKAALDALASVAKQPRAQILRRRVEPLYDRADEQRRAAEARAEAEKLIARGAYEEALALAERALEVQPQNKELQELRKSAQIGERLLGQASGHLELAAGELEKRKLGEAHDKIKLVLGWHNQPLASLPGGERLSGSVGRHLLHFHLPGPLSGRARLLQGDHQLIRDVRENVEGAQSKDDYETVVSELKRLEGGKIKLSKEESEWLEDAESQVESLAQAQELIASAKARELTASAEAFKQLAEAYELLSDNRSAQAAPLRHKIGERWVALVVKSVTDLSEAHERLAEGAELLRQTESAPRLRKMQALAERALGVASELELVDEAKWPAWMAGEQRGSELIRLHETLKALSGDADWPFLQEQSGQWQQRLNGMLADYLGHERNSVADLSKRYDFEGAQEKSQAVWQSIPDLSREQLPVALRLRWQRLIEAVEARRKADQTGLGLLDRLVKKALTFGEVVSQMREWSLPAHPDVPVDDLSALPQELAPLVEIESKLKAARAEEDYAGRIHDLRELAERAMTIQSPFVARLEPALAEPLQQRAQDLHSSLTSSAEQTGQELCEALKQATEALSQRPDSDPAPLLRLYWQARWWQLATPEPLPLAEAACRGARNLVSSIMMLAEAHFVTIRAAGELEELSRVLETLRALNQDLARQPTREGQPLILLPPLPAGVSLEDEPQQDHRAIERWIAIASQLNTLLRAEFEPPQEYDANQVSTVEQQARTLQQTLQRLKEQVWSPLGLPEWGDDSLLAQLEQEAERYQEVAAKFKAAQQAYQPGQADQAVRTLAAIERQITNGPPLAPPNTPHAGGRRGGIDAPWLLEPQRRILVHNLSMLRQGLSAKSLAEAKRELEPGNYREALPYASEAVKLRPSDKEAQETAAWAKAGVRLVEQAQQDIEEALGGLPARKLEQSAEKVRGVLSWRDKPLSLLPKGKILPREIRLKPFRLPQELDQNAHALQERVGLVRSALQRAEDAQGRFDYEALIKELESLSKEVGLTDSESQWLREARSQSNKLAQARRLIDDPPSSFEKLQQAYALLMGHPSPQATHLRNQIGEQWVRLVEADKNPEGVVPDILKGIELDTQSQSRLQNMLASAQQASKVLRDLAPADGKGWPVWLEQNKRKSELERLNQAFDVLNGEASWPRLREQAAFWQQQLIAMLAAYLRQEHTLAIARCEKGKFEEAALLAEAWEAIPDSFRQQLPGQLREEVQPLSEALKARREVERVVRQLLKELAQPKATFGEAAARMNGLSWPAHPHVPMGDFDALRAELAQAVQMESVLNDAPSGNYAQRIHQRRLLTKQEVQFASVANIEPGLVEPLSERVQKLQKSLKQSEDKIERELRGELNEAVEVLERPPHAVPGPLLPLYWQASWYEKETGNDSAKPALENVLGTVRFVLQEAEKCFAAMSDARELDKVSNLLGTVDRLNRELATLPWGDGQPAIPLPPLPEGGSLAREPQFDQQAIERWVEVVGDLNALSQAPDERQNAIIKKLAPNLQRLQEEVWPALNLEWAEKSVPHKLKREVEEYQKLATVLPKAQRKHRSGEALDAFNDLETHFPEDPSSEPPTLPWLFKPQRRGALIQSLKKLRKTLSRELAGEADQVLKRAKEHLQQGRYNDGLASVHQAIKLQSKNPERHELLEWAEAGVRLVNEAQDNLESAKQELRGRNLYDVGVKRRHVLSLDDKRLGVLPEGASLSDMVWEQKFLLPEGLKKEANSLQEQLRLVRDVREKVEDARSREDHGTVIRELERLEKQKLLNDEEQAWLEAAREQHKMVNRVTRSIESASSIDKLRDAHALLSNEGLKDATELRKQVGTKWVELAESLTDLAEVRRVVEEGITQLSQTPSRETLQEMQGQLDRASQIPTYIKSIRGLMTQLSKSPAGE